MNKNECRCGKEIYKKNKNALKRNLCISFYAKSLKEKIISISMELTEDENLKDEYLRDSKEEIFTGITRKRKKDFCKVEDCKNKPYNFNYCIDHGMYNFFKNVDKSFNDILIKSNIWNSIRNNKSYRNLIKESHILSSDQAYIHYYYFLIMELLTVLYEYHISYSLVNTSLNHQKIPRLKKKINLSFDFYSGLIIPNKLFSLARSLNQNVFEYPPEIKIGDRLQIIYSHYHLIINDFFSGNIIFSKIAERDKYYSKCIDREELSAFNEDINFNTLVYLCIMIVDYSNHKQIESSKSKYGLVITDLLVKQMQFNTTAFKILNIDSISNPKVNSHHNSIINTSVVINVHIPEILKMIFTQTKDFLLTEYASMIILYELVAFERKHKFIEHLLFGINSIVGQEHTDQLPPSYLNELRNSIHEYAKEYFKIADSDSARIDFYNKLFMYHINAHKIFSSKKIIGDGKTDTNDKENNYKTIPSRKKDAQLTKIELLLRDIGLTHRARKSFIQNKHILRPLISEMTNFIPKLDLDTPKNGIIFKAQYAFSNNEGFNLKHFDRDIDMN